MSDNEIYLATTHSVTKASTSGYFQLNRNLAALISLAVFCSGSFILSTQSVVAKNSRTNSRIDRNYFVPPPPPYTPSVVPAALGMTDAQAVTTDAYGVVVGKPGNAYNKYILTHNQGSTPQVVQPNPYLTYDRAAETKIQKHVDTIDSEISGLEKEIGKLLDL